MLDSTIVRYDANQFTRCCYLNYNHTFSASSQFFPICNTTKEHPMHHTRCLCIRVEHISGNVGISMRWRIIKLTHATPFSTTSSHARVASSMELSQTSHTHYSTKVSDNVQHASYTTCMKTIFRKSACAYACSRTLLLRSACITLRTRSTSVICKLQHALILHTQWGESLTEQEQGGPGLWPPQRKSE